MFSALNIRLPCGQPAAAFSAAGFALPNAFKRSRAALLKPSAINCAASGVSTSFKPNTANTIANNTGTLNAPLSNSGHPCHKSKPTSSASAHCCNHTYTLAHCCWRNCRRPYSASASRNEVSQSAQRRHNNNEVMRLSGISKRRRRSSAACVSCRAGTMPRQAASAGNTTPASSKGGST